MGEVFGGLEDGLREFISAQHVFFVATAPLSAEGHVNLSPKGLDTFRVLGPRQLAYLDLTGSGVETVSHLKENGRIVLMFCAFQGPPKILRVYGRGRAVEPTEAEFEALAAHFPDLEGKRSVIIVDISRIADSCGFGVPLLKFEAQRDQLTAWASRLGTEKMAAYRSERNSASIDGMRGLEPQPKPAIIEP